MCQHETYPLLLWNCCPQTYDEPLWNRKYDSHSLYIFNCNWMHGGAWSNLFEVRSTHRSTQQWGLIDPWDSTTAYFLGALLSTTRSMKDNQWHYISPRIPIELNASCTHFSVYTTENLSRQWECHLRVDPLLQLHQLRMTKHSRNEDNQRCLCRLAGRVTVDYTECTHMITPNSKLYANVTRQWPLYKTRSTKTNWLISPQGIIIVYILLAHVWLQVHQVASSNLRPPWNRILKS